MKATISTDNISSIEKVLRNHPFVVPSFLQNYNIQTFIAGVAPYFTTAMPQVERKYIRLFDNSHLAADCWWQKNKEKCATVIVLSGLEGYQRKKRSSFVKQISYKAYYRGFNVIHLKQRAEGDTIHLTKSLFSIYPVDDITKALEEFNSWGLTRYYIAGLSGGGWVALFTVSKLRQELKKYILGVISIDAPISFFSAWDHVQTQIFYKWLLLHLYKTIVKRRIRIDPKGTWDAKQLRAIKTLRQWGDAYVYTFKKFATIDDYHRETDLTQLLPTLQIPTLIIHAKDDPIIPIAPFMRLKNPFIITLFSKHGGHGGFFTSKKLYEDLDGHWAQNRAMEFIRLLEEKQ